MDARRKILASYGADEVLFRRLWRANAEFRTVCEDLALARQARERWQGNPLREADYSEIAGRLEQELGELLDRARLKA